MEAEWGAVGGTPACTPAPPLALTRTLRVAAFGEILALHDLVNDVICIDARVVHPRGVALHRVLLPPGGEGTAMGWQGQGRHRTSAPATHQDRGLT